MVWVKGARVGRCVLGSALLVQLVTAPLAFAQRPKVETFSVDDGLPSANIFDLAQDERSGRLAILTRAGVTVYDGHTFTTYTHADGLPTGGLGALAIDPDGRLWTMAHWEEPIVCRLERRWRCSSSPSIGASPSLEMTSLAIADGDGGILAAVGSPGGGLWLWEEDGEMESRTAWQGWQSADGLPSDEVYAIVSVEEGFAVGTRAGLCFLREGALDLRLHERVPRLRDPILALHSAPDGRDDLWILSRDWLGRLEDGRFEVVASGLDLPWAPEVSGGVLLADASGRVYFGTQLGAFVRDPQDGHVAPLGRRQGLVSDGASALLLDRETNLWVGSSRGLSRIESRRFLSFDESHDLLEDEVTALVEPLPGRFVLGHNKGLTLLDLERSSTVRVSFDLPPFSGAYRIMDMALDPDGSVWLAANTKGLLQLDPPFHPAGAAHPGRAPTWRVRLPAPAILSVELDAAGRLWAMSAADLFVREGDRFVRVEHGHGRLRALRWLEAGRDGGLFVSTGRGLLCYDGTEWRLARASGHDANILYGLHVAPSGTVWVGTLDGLHRLQGGELVAVRQGELDISRPVYFILEDGGGRLWFGTDDGVFVWDGSRLRHLSVPHGLAGRETNRGAGILDHRGRVWIGTDRGVSVYQERHDQPHRAPPLVELGALEVNGREQSADGELQLAPHQKNLTFPFRTITFSTEAAVVVRYRLHPFDSGWSTRVASAGEIRYTNIPPGRYRFHIAAGWAGDQDDAWSAEARSPEIAIPRPLWRQPWLLVLETLAMVLSVVGAYRFRTRALLRRAREREALITELEARNAELERFTYTVSHDLTSPLVTIKGFLGLLRRDAVGHDAERLEHDIRQIEDAADKMGRLLGELLELSRIGRVAHSSEAVALGEVVSEAAALLAGEIVERGVDVEVAPDLPVVVGDRVRLREVFQNLIDNAVRFMGDEAHPQIEIGVGSQDGEDVLFVRDNGIGIDPSYHEKIFGLFERLDAEIEGTGIGLALVKRIIEVHGGRIWVESEGAGKGSTLCFTLKTFRNLAA